MSYPIGTILHGNNAARGNLWIITVDSSLDASLLFDGTTKSVVTDSLYKRDKMSPNMRIADMNDVVGKIGSYSQIPQWAVSLMLSSVHAARPTLPKPSTILPSGVLQQINKSFAAVTPQKQLNDLGLTKPKSYGNFQSIHDDMGTSSLRNCPSRREGYCFYEPYYGFTDNYEYCIYCDHKRNMRK